MAEALAGHPGLVLARRATRSFEALDFTVLGPGERLAQIELKAKHQPYRGWAQLAEDRPEVPSLVVVPPKPIRRSSTRCWEAYWPRRQGH